MLVVFIVFSLFPPVLAEESSAASDSVFLLPGSLQQIGDEAFEGIAAETVIAQRELLCIGEGVFANNHHLMDIYIPQATESISDTAFLNTQNYSIHGVAGSYAEDWAEENQIPFTPDYDMWRVYILNERFPGVQGFSARHRFDSINPQKTITANTRGVEEGISKRPQDRPELNPIDYRFP